MRRAELRFFSGFVIAATLALGAVNPAAAQNTPEHPEVPTDESVFDGDYVIVGVGVMSAPTYMGSDNSRILPAAGATGEVAGVSFTVRGPSLSLDFLPDKLGSDFGFRFGPQVRLRSNRGGKVKDPVVARLGKLDDVIEAGFRAGVSFDDVISREDSLSVGVSARWDVSGKGSGRVVTPSASYLLPVSRGHAFGLLVSAQFGDDKFARYNFDVTSEGAAASGLPAYQAKGGLHEVSVGLATARDLNNDFLDGGFAIGAGVMYSRLYGSAARTPITRIRGSRDQWIFGGGLSYTF